LATRIRISLVLAVLLLGSGIPAARAMQFELVPVSPTEIIIGGRGEIVEGDSTRLDRALASVSPGQTLLSLAIDSPGGSVLEGELMSRTIRGRGLAVVIPANSKCVSACFLLFAASTHRLASSDALIGVHSANEGGQETGNSLAVTTLMARSAADLGVPPAIIGKMVQTTPGRVEWLTHDDLLSMDVTVFNTDAASASRSAGATTTASIRPVVPEPAPAPPQLAAPPPPSAVMAGSNDRRAWDAWLGSLRGGVRDGALYARAQIQQSRPVSCVQPKGMAQADFQQGCLEYQRRATAVDARKRASADYERLRPHRRRPARGVVQLRPAGQRQRYRQRRLYRPGQHRPERWFVAVVAGEMGIPAAGLSMARFDRPVRRRRQDIQWAIAANH